MNVIAHRGYSGKYPENTMLAFRKAVDAGCDEIELDVQLTRDGTVVIIHDETTDRVTGATGAVRDFSFEELRKLNVSSTYGDTYGVNPIPSLDEYFSWVKGTKIATNIELKNGGFYYEGLEEKTIALIKKHSLENRVMFSSFNHPSLLKCKQLAPSIPCGALAEWDMGNAAYYVKSLGFECYHPGIKFLDDKVVAECKKQGVKLNVWTVNDMASLLKLAAWDCGGVITNFPGVCKAWLLNRN
jgi:glycerophosphoryl diester phosphodiesterase